MDTQLAHKDTASGPAHDTIENAEPQAVIRHANVRDVPALVDMINGYASEGQMLPRSRHNVYQYLRDFLVTEVDGRIVGCSALHIIWEDIGEVRSLAVDPEWVGQGFGQRMVRLLLDEALSLGLPRVFALTYQQGFFEGLGFKVVSKDELPHKVWGDCLNCPKFPNCDEIAMSREL